ncbi:cyclic nucleotide-binding domain-containing protein [Methylobacter sp.]|uniref:Crp/Fnr family transcriptional regulator n=1 Tax=Methylobacter sp. TaxID=2051955 RepID=UPI0011FEE0B3|nr:cyclic nucleotide-binding domain-containing protein [Methylobacter sp.]TAK59989.1 MAG: cyclic nucleotide-binding domain-containing protein [Methylobacter sp.]
MENLIKQIIDDQSFPKGVAWQRWKFYANEVIVKEGDVAKSLFFVESGQLRVSVHVELEERRNLKTGVGDLGKGDLFGDTCLHESSVRTASVIAITDGCLLEINGEKLGEYLDAHPTKGYLFYKELFEILFKRLSSGNRRIEYLLAWGLKARRSSEKSIPIFRKI